MLLIVFGCCLVVWGLLFVLFVWRQGLDMPEGAIRSRASEPLERQVELFKRRLPSWLQLWCPSQQK